MVDIKKAIGAIAAISILLLFLNTITGGFILQRIQELALKEQVEEVTSCVVGRALAGPTIQIGKLTLPFVSLTQIIASLFLVGSINFLISAFTAKKLQAKTTILFSFYVLAAFKIFGLYLINRTPGCGL